MAMDAATPSSREELLFLLTSANLREQLVHLAHRRGLAWRDAKKAANLALVYAIEASASSWDRGREPDVFRHLGILVNRFVWAREIKTSTQLEARSWVDSVERTAPWPLHPEEMLLDAADLESERARVNGRLEALRETLGSDPSDVARCALRVFDLGLSGIGNATDQAAALGRSPRAVLRAREHIAKSIDGLAVADGARRMPDSSANDAPTTDPLDVWRAIEDLRADVAMNEILEVAVEARRDALRKQGIDPGEARRVGESAIREAARKAGVALPADAFVPPHEAVTRPIRVAGNRASSAPTQAPRAPGAPYRVWIAIALAAASLFAWKHAEIAALWAHGAPANGAITRPTP
jgi:hypothetical protein